MIRVHGTERGYDPPMSATLILVVGAAFFILAGTLGP